MKSSGTLASIVTAILGIAGGCSSPVTPTTEVTPKSFVDPALVPVFGRTVSATPAPPPISGGTLIVLRDGVTAVAADPDRNAVYVVNTKEPTVTHTIALLKGDEPGRLAEDGAGRVHVALRSGGALVTLDPALGVVTARRNVCPAPRGVAWDSTTDSVWVACATGELVSLPASGGAATTNWTVERDLRDIVIQSGALSVTEFRSAQVLRMGSTGTITRRDAMPSGLGQSAGQPAFAGFVPHVAWRAVEGPSGSMVIAHQEHSSQNIQTAILGGYGQGPESGAVGSECTVLGADGAVLSSLAIQAVLPVDVAVSPDGTFAAVVGAGDSFASGLATLTIVALGGTAPPQGSPDADAPVGLPAAAPAPPFSNAGVQLPAGRQATAVAFDGRGNVLIQTREPASLWVIPVPSGGVNASGPWSTPNAPIELSSLTRDDTGHDIFHTSAGALIACASCHPEGGDDSHVWLLDSAQRRTPSLRGTVAGTAPYHWPGDEPDLPTLTGDVYNVRMAGQALDPEQMSALESWIQSIPAPTAPSWVDPAAAARGGVLFNGAVAQCSACHSGAKLTNNQTIDVGTGQAFQVPPLIGVGWRTPLLHDGCAATVADRFAASCATPAHGNISALTTQNIVDMTAYLDSL